MHIKMFIYAEEGEIMTQDTLTRQLRFWFTIHFVADVLVAVPLFLSPDRFLGMLGWNTVDPVAARLVAAALFGIGIESFLGRGSSTSTFREMLHLKIIWSSVAIAGLIISLVEGVHGRTWALWVFLGIFVVFNVLWSWFLFRIRKAAHDSTIQEHP